MKRMKKFLVGLLAVLSVLSGSLGLVACGGNDSSSSLDEATEIEKVYAQYVVYAQAEGQAPLSYEDWLATIKGEKGDKGDTGAQGEKGERGEQGVGVEKVEFDENGDLLIIFTDGTKQTVEMPTVETGGLTSLIDKGATEGLHYQKIAGKEEYRVIGLGLATETDIVISSTYNGLPVTEIGYEAFYYCSYYILTSIEIPNSVTVIGDFAFSGCESLERITFNGTVEEWNAIEKSYWNGSVPATKVVCSDGEVAL